MTTPADERINRLEEHAAFAERTVEHLSQEIAAVNAKLQATLKRLEALENRLGKVAQRIEAADPD